MTSQVPQLDQSYHLLVLKNRGGLVVPSCGTVAVLLSAERAIRSLMNVYTVKRICKLPQVAMIVKAELGTCDVFQMGAHI